MASKSAVKRQSSASAFGFEHTLSATWTHGGKNMYLLLSFSTRISPVLLAVALLAFAPATACAQFVPGTVIDFEDNSLAGFGGAAPAIVTDPVGGDLALQISTNGNADSGGSNLVAANASLTGNFLAAGLSAISLDAFNPNLVELNVRLGLAGPGGSVVSNDIVLEPGVGNTLTFALQEDLFVELRGSFAETLANVTDLRILHNPAAVAGNNALGSAQGEGVLQNGSPIAASLVIDNVTAIPEPSSLVLVSLCGLGLATRRR